MVHWFVLCYMPFSVDLFAACKQALPKAEDARREALLGIVKDTLEQQGAEFAKSATIEERASECLLTVGAL